MSDAITDCQKDSKEIKEGNVDLVKKGMLLKRLYHSHKEYLELKRLFLRRGFRVDELTDEVKVFKEM